MFGIMWTNRGCMGISLAGSGAATFGIFPAAAPAASGSTGGIGMSLRQI
jgi:hypothetical protein